MTRRRVETGKSQRRTSAPLSAATEDYLKAIYKLCGEDGAASTQALSQRLGVSAPSATAMVKKLASQKLVSHTPYRGVELTPSGEKIALEIIRHHRLIETYLAEILGMDWDKVHDEAERWEHVLGEEAEARIAALLGNPQHDPHGAPIPSVDGVVAREKFSPLSQARAGQKLLVQRVSDEDAELLRHLRKIGIVPRAEIEVVRAESAEGVLHLRVGGKKQMIGSAPAQGVFVGVVET
jgi:DtxR family Mn-dependent transcriptional regulator